MSLSSNQPAGQGQRGAAQTPFPSGPLARNPSIPLPGGQTGVRPSGPLARNPNTPSSGGQMGTRPTSTLAQKQEEPRPQPAQTIRPKAKSSGGRNLFLDLPIAGRLALGFAIAALVAGLAAGVVGLERSQSLSKQTDFYHHLLQLNTSLTTGHSFLELMNSELQKTVDDASAPNPSHETLTQDKNALSNLTQLYTQTLNAYVQQDLLDQHADQMALLNEAGDGGLAQQQRTLTSSSQRTWQYYQDAQQEVSGYLFGNKITPTDIKNAQLVLQLQAQPTNADALSALHSLIQLDDRLASAVDNATNIEIHNESLTTLLATAGAFLLIALVGWFISDTLVRRLHHLQRVTRAVEEGRITERVRVAGRDEIGEVSLAVNAMLDTIVGLLEETRQQRDALTGAAEHLFTDMRIVNAGDLRISATVSNDPIGMLANAFNFTVGRFRRFLMRTQTSIEQLDVVARQSQERSSSFISMVRVQLRDISTPRPPQEQALSTGPLGRSSSSIARGGSGSHKELSEVGQDAQFVATRNELNTRLTGTRETIERATLSIRRLSELISAPAGSIAEKTVQAQLQELATLDHLLHRLTREVRQTQQNATTNFTKLADVVAARSNVEYQEPDTTGNTQSIPEAQYQDFVRQAGSFAVEVNALAKRLAAIIQEMRTGIVPFHLEGAGNQGDPFRMATNQLESEPLATSSASLSNW